MQVESLKLFQTKELIVKLDKVFCSDGHFYVVSETRCSNEVPPQVNSSTYHLFVDADLTFYNCIKPFIPTEPHNFKFHA